MKKNKRAEVNIVGLILVAFVAIIVGVALFQAAASNIEKATQSSTGVSTKGVTYQANGVLNTAVELAGQELVTIVSVQNESGGVTVPAANYTLAECVRASDGMKGICYTTRGATAYNSLGTSGGGKINISYTYYPEGYIDDAGARGIASIILIFLALLIAIVALTPTLRSGLIDAMN